MGPIKVDRIISINSEEQSYKAENILNSLNPRKTWRCKPGEKQAIVILQFLETSIISSIDVGNNSSAFIEIFVGKSTSDDFQVLLVTSSLMTLHECKNGLNLNKVCFFNTSQLSTACNESWDRVKIVCTQPYIKQCSFGLSFITFHSKDIPQKKPIQQPMSGLVQLGLFSLRNDDEEDNLHAPGKLFNKHNANKTIVDNDAPIQSIISLHKNNLAKRENCSRTDKPSRINSDNSHLSSPIIKHIEPVTPSRNKATTNTKSPESSTSRNQRDEPLSKRIKFSKTTSVTQRPFDELFDKVVFSISGYENPYRSVIRSKALEMGAIYKNNWDKSCTHLVCAFMNTPKYQEVKRQGFNRIVTGSWIDICHEKRCKIPWRRFALDKSEGNKCESEDEIKEFVPSTNFNTDNTSSKKLSPSTSQSKDIIHQDCSSIDLNIYDKPTEVHENVKPPPVNTDNTSSK